MKNEVKAFFNIMNNTHNRFKYNDKKDRNFSFLLLIKLSIKNNIIINNYTILNFLNKNYYYFF